MNAFFQLVWQHPLRAEQAAPVAKWPIGILGVLWVTLLSGGIWLSLEAGPRSQFEQPDLPSVTRELDWLESAIVSMADETPAANMDAGWKANRTEVAPATGPTTAIGTLNLMEEPNGVEFAEQEQTIGNLDETEWGALAEISGLQSRLTLQTGQPQIGQPLLVKLELRNSGDKPTEFDPQKYAPFRVLRVDVPRPDLPPPFIGVESQTAGKTDTLQPGETKVLWENIDVSELFLLNEVREYEVFAEGGEWAMQTTWRDSNRLRVTLLPGALPPRQQLIEALLQITPASWKLSVGSVEIYLQHTPSNLKDESVSLIIRFLTEKLPPNFEIGLPIPGQDRSFARAQIEYFGETKLGHAYLIGLHRQTESLWPNYLTELKQAMKAVKPPSTDAPPSTQEVGGDAQ
jgi:hypothetical protein